MELILLHLFLTGGGWKFISGISSLRNIFNSKEYALNNLDRLFWKIRLVKISVQISFFVIFWTTPVSIPKFLFLWYFCILTFSNLLTNIGIVIFQKKFVSDGSWWMKSFPLFSWNGKRRVESEKVNFILMKADIVDNM